MSIKAIIFDLFGVIFKDRWKEWKEENAESLKAYLQSEPPLVELGLNPHYPEYYSDLIRLNTDEKDQKGYQSIDDETFYNILERASGKSASSIREVIHDTTVLNKGLVDIIKEFKEKGYKIGLITNSDRKITNEFLMAHNLVSVFDGIVTSAEVGKKKPDPLIFNKIALILKTSFQEMLLIDDSEEVVTGANLLGINVIHYQDQNAAMLEKEMLSIIGGVDV